MTDSHGFISRVLEVIREKAFLLGLLLVAGEAVIWLSGKGSLGLMLLLAAMAACAGFLGAVVRVLLDGRRK